MGRLEGKVAIITGAGSGIGKSVAILFAKEGSAVGVSDINLENAKEVVKDITAAGGKAIAIHMNVADEKSVNEGVKQTVEKFGGVHILVSNAGIQHIDKIVDLSFENWKKVTSVHLDGAFLTTKACMKEMIAQKSGGRILYTGSVHSKLVSAHKAPYCSSKHGIMGLSRTVAKEGAVHGISSNVVCPGFVYTPLVAKQIPEQAKSFGISEEKVVKEIMLKDTVDKEFTTLDEVAECFLDLAAFGNGTSLALTGQSLIVSHGWCLE